VVDVTRLQRGTQRLPLLLIYVINARSVIWPGYKISPVSETLPCSVYNVRATKQVPSRDLVCYSNVFGVY
jgi:hypothetical protein